MLTPYDKAQQARERAALTARRTAEKIAATPATALTFACDWDQELANLLGTPADTAGPAPATLHKPTHGGCPS